MLWSIELLLWAYMTISIEGGRLCRVQSQSKQKFGSLTKLSMDEAQPQMEANTMQAANVFRHCEQTTLSGGETRGQGRMRSLGKGWDQRFFSVQGLVGWLVMVNRT